MALREELKKQGDFLFRYRSHLPLALLAAGLWVKIYQERFNGDASEQLLAEALERLGPFVGLLGLAIRMFTVGHTPKSTSGRNTKQGQVAEVLNTTGAYSLVRNPLYLGNYFAWVAVAMITGSLSFVVIFSLVFWIYYERIVYAEETFLREKFGSTYLDWAAKTPAFLPTHFNYSAPRVGFSWKKVAKKEKDGLFALFLLFCIFGLVGDYAEGEVSFTEESLSIVGAATTGVIYLVFKFLKKHTSVLNEYGR